MKTRITLLLLLLTAIIISCSPESTEGTTEDLSTNWEIGEIGEIGDVDGGVVGDPSISIYQTDLMAGQNILMGFVDVSLVDGNVEVTYNADYNWEIEETHLYVGDLANLPTNNGGNPKIGQFPYKATHQAGTTTVTYIGPAMAAGECVYVAAHAVVSNTSNGQTETAWGAGVPIGGNSWAMMFEVCN